MAKAQISHAQPDDLLDFYHLKSRELELEDEVQEDFKHATGEFVKDADEAYKLNRILQLAGFSDPVYAEAYVTVHHYDIVLDITVINRTKETLQNLCVELANMGDLKLVERPQNYTLAPESSKQIKANIKVSSTETGLIIGNIVYETSNMLERSVVVLNDFHIDIMDYISPAVCIDAAFRITWAEFEWENKAAINSVVQDEKEFLDHIIKSTNMKCLTALSALDGECGFLAANLYAKSVFGEDALVNVRVKKQADGKLSGYIRIRSKTQGIALSLGDKITLKQKGGRVGGVIEFNVSDSDPDAYRELIRYLRHNVLRDLLVSLHGPKCFLRLPGESNMYFIGFCGDSGVFFQLSDWYDLRVIQRIDNIHMEEMVPRISVRYKDLSRETSRGQLQLGKHKLVKAVENLSTYKRNDRKPGVRSDLLIICQMISESLRFDSICQRIYEIYGREGTLDLTLIAKQNNYAKECARFTVYTINEIRTNVKMEEEDYRSIHVILQMKKLKYSSPRDREFQVHSSDCTEEVEHSLLHSQGKEI
ncbi:hypothetical protein PTKIN_Ptkin19aG0117000 [Pterospermum kingtungense]